jgi:AraC-like DNA-binding protein
MSQDTLSDVLRTVRLQGAVFFYVSGGREWAAESPASKDIASAVMPGAEHVMQYHVVIAGDCWAGIVGQPPLRLGAGDIVLFPLGDAHVISSAPGMRAEPNVAWFYEAKIDQLPIRIAYEGTNGPTPALPGQSGLTTIVCGFISCDVKPFNPLIATLPRLLHLRASEVGGWGAQFLQQAVAESHASRPGSEAMLARMSEMLFVDAVRRYVDTLPPEGTGWLAGLRDRFVGRALALLHEKPAEAWTIDELGRQVGLSRSALHERFVQFVGQAPMQYLAHWRMQLASGLLRSSNSTVATIALEVGYDSEAAFARAFKRLVGMPPAAWRRALSDKQQRDRGTAAEPASTRQPIDPMGPG